MENPFFSIITPTFNRCNKLTNSLNSVFGQTFTNFELIIIDDASTDDTQILLQNFSKQHEFINLNNKFNLGVNKSKNIATSVAKGNYLIFLDSDDELMDLNSLFRISWTQFFI